MNKIIKKIAILLMTMFIVVTVLPAQDVRAEEDTYTIYVQTPDSWGAAYIWAWGDSGVGDMSKTWPGELMQLNSDGKYTYVLKDKYINLVISDGGSSQTSDIRVNGSDVEIVINTDGSYTVNYLDGFEKDWENGITVTATIPSDWTNPYIWAWDDTIGNVYEKWPGAPMESSGDTYTMELPDWVTGVIINANNAGVQTIDISVEAGKDIWFQVNSTSDVVVEYTGPAVPEGDDGSAEEGTTPVGEDASNDATTAPEGQDSNNNGDDKGNNNNVIYIVVTVAVFVIIILIVTFTGNGRNKKHSQRRYVEDSDIGDIKIDDKDLDIDVDDIDV